MSILDDLTKQAKSILQDKKKKEKMGDAVEGVLKEVKKSIKSEETKKMLDKAIQTVDQATTTKSKSSKKVTSTKKPSTSKTTKSKETKSSKSTSSKTSKESKTTTKKKKK